MEFTVLFPVYYKDEPSVVQGALRSIVENVVLPSKVLIIVDGAIDPSLGRALDGFLEYQTRLSIDIVRLPKNLGLANALNVGLSMACTEWVFRADADDYNHPSRFDQQVRYIEAHPHVDVLGTQIVEAPYYGANGTAVRKVPQSHHEIIASMSRRNPINHMTVAYRRSQALKVGGYPSLQGREDYGLWARLAMDGAIFANLPSALVTATTDGNFISRRGGFGYAKAEFRLQAELINSGISNGWQATALGAVRAGFFILPEKLRTIIYKFVLRERI